MPLEKPALEADGRKVSFPVSLQPDAYLEWDGTGPVRHFDPNGKRVGDVQPAGSLLLLPGDNHLRFSCGVGDGTTPRAEVTLAAKGEPLSGRRGE